MSRPTRTVYCPHCHQGRTTRAYGGSVALQCTGCGRLFRAPSGTGDQAPPTGAPANPPADPAPTPTPAPKAPAATTTGRAKPVVRRRPAPVPQVEPAPADPVLEDSPPGPADNRPKPRPTSNPLRRRGATRAGR